MSNKKTRANRLTAGLKNKNNPKEGVLKAMMGNLEGRQEDVDDDLLNLSVAVKASSTSRVERTYVLPFRTQGPWWLTARVVVNVRIPGAWRSQHQKLRD